MRACTRVALASIAVCASFSLWGCAAIEELKETLFRWVDSQKFPSGPDVSAGELPEATPVAPGQDSCDSTGENVEGAEQAASTTEACSAQSATAGRCASSKETADPQFHRRGEARRDRGAIRAVSKCAEVAA